MVKKMNSAGEKVAIANFYRVHAYELHFKSPTLKQLPIYANKRASLEVATITNTNCTPYSSAISAPEFNEY